VLNGDFAEKQLRTRMRIARDLRPRLATAMRRSFEERNLE
jgi:hypothetical protein